MDLNIYIPVITALVGALVGASIKELGAFFQSYRDDKRILKKVLFNQLDIWYEVKRCDVGPIISGYLKRVEKRLTEEGASSEQINMLIEQVRPQSEMFLRSLKLGEPQKLQQRYQDAVNELAKVDPILAYKLSGKPNLEDTQAKLEESLSRAVVLYSNPATFERDVKFKNYMESTYKEKVLQQILDTLKKDILRVSWRIHLFTLFRAYRTLRKMEHRSRNEIEAESDEIIGTMISILKETSKQPEA